MNDVDPLVATGLDRLVPLPSGARADWPDVVRRAGQDGGTRRSLVFALAGVAAATLLALATPIGPAVARGIADFSAWLTGNPGKRASSSEQRAFDAGNGRSWDAFPTGTELRELIRTNVDGKQYVLSGFRSGTSLCLQLNGPTRRERLPEPACVPTSVLAHASVPIAVVRGNGAFYDQYSHASAEYSFGIAADGVRQVAVHALDGDHRALVGGNSYLWIEPEPNSVNRVERISAIGSHGRSTGVPVERYPFYTGAPPLQGTPGGPTHVERIIRHPTIGWHVRHEKRGMTPAQAGLAPTESAACRQREAVQARPDEQHRRRNRGRLVHGLESRLRLR